MLYCMKCGKEIPETQVFCESCLAVMKRFPVKPETHVLLPARSAPETVKKAAPRKKVLTPEEKITRLRKAVQWLTVLLIAALLALALAVTLLVDTMLPEATDENIGQNYSTADISERMK